IGDKIVAKNSTITTIQTNCIWSAIERVVVNLDVDVSCKGSVIGPAEINSSGVIRDHVVSDNQSVLVDKRHGSSSAVVDCVLFDEIVRRGAAKRTESRNDLRTIGRAN